MNEKDVRPFNWIKLWSWANCEMVITVIALFLIGYALFSLPTIFKGVKGSVSDLTVIVICMTPLLFFGLNIYRLITIGGLVKELHELMKEQGIHPNFSK